MSNWLTSMVNTVNVRFYNNNSVFNLKRVIPCNPENSYLIAKQCRIKLLVM